MKGVILAAGEGTRMRPLTYRRPKPLVPVVDRPMIEHILRGGAAAGVDQWLVVVGYKGEMIAGHLGDGSALGISIVYAWQEKPTGTGAAVLLAEEFAAGDPFLLSWGDIMVPAQNYRRVAQAWAEPGTDLALTVNVVDDPWAGAAVYVEDRRVTRIIEKPPRGTSTTNYNNAGVFIISGAIFDYLRRTEPSARGERELTDAIQLLLAEGRSVRAVAIEGYWSDVASPQAVIELNAQMIADRSADGLLVDASAQVSEAARLVPPVYIAPGCVVAEGAVVGPNACLLAGAAVGAKASVSAAMIYAGGCAQAEVTVNRGIVEEGQVASTDLVGTADHICILPE